jgi:hypothetical protein
MRIFQLRSQAGLSAPAIVALLLTTGVVGVAAFALVDPPGAIVATIACAVALSAVLRSARRLRAIVGRCMAVLMLALVVLVTFWVLSFPRWIVRDTDMKRWIATELPPGSSAARVRAFLHRHTEPGEVVYGFTDGQGAGIFANIEPNYYELVCSGDLQISFYLGRTNHLSHYDIVERPVCL